MLKNYTSILEFFKEYRCLNSVIYPNTTFTCKSGVNVRGGSMYYIYNFDSPSCMGMYILSILEFMYIVILFMFLYFLRREVNKYGHNTISSFLSQDRLFNRGLNKVFASVCIAMAVIILIIEIPSSLSILNIIGSVIKCIDCIVFIFVLIFPGGRQHDADRNDAFLFSSKVHTPIMTICLLLGYIGIGLSEAGSLVAFNYFNINSINTIYLFCLSIISLIIFLISKYNKEDYYMFISESFLLFFFFSALLVSTISTIEPVYSMEGFHGIKDQMPWRNNMWYLYTNSYCYLGLYEILTTNYWFIVFVFTVFMIPSIIIMLICTCFPLSLKQFHINILGALLLVSLIIFTWIQSDVVSWF